MANPVGPPSAHGWFLDEVVSAGRENLDAEHVARYDTKEDAGAADEVRLLRNFGFDAHSEVVDLGAGTGQFAVTAAAACRHVVAIDVSPVMVEHLRRKAAAAGLPNVEIVQSGFLTYEHRGDPPDFVYSRYALHHLPDFWKAVALDRIRRIMRPGGVLRLWDVVYDFDAADACERIETWCATGGHDAESEWSRDELEEHVRDEFSTFTWLLESMMHRAGFTIEESRHSPDGIFAGYIARAV